MDKLKILSDLIFPDVTENDTIESLEALFPERGLKEGAKVTRMAPSPTLPTLPAVHLFSVLRIPMTSAPLRAELKK